MKIDNLIALQTILIAVYAFVVGMFWGEVVAGNKYEKRLMKILKKKYKSKI